MQGAVDGFKVWESISPITLGEMDSITLMNRVDSKYTTTEPVLERLLEKASSLGYRALEVDGAMICPYNSMYFDTPSLRMFQDHHNRRLVRQKIRTRVYVSSGTTFLEVKRKNNHGRTKKKRTRIPSAEFGDFRGDSTAEKFLSEKSGYSPSDIAPRLETIFRRITLVNKAKTERITIDTSLRFVNHDTSLQADLSDAVIIELKQDGRAPSEMKSLLLSLRIKPIRISKYCIGTTLTNPGIKSNRFKSKVRRIEKLIGRTISPSPIQL